MPFMTVNAVMEGFFWIIPKGWGLVVFSKDTAYDLRIGPTALHT